MPGKTPKKKAPKTKAPPKEVERPKKRKWKYRTTKERIQAFLLAYANKCNMRAAAEEVGITLNAHYAWMKKFPKYAAVFNEITREAADYLESCAVDRATEGWLEPIYYQGKRCGSVRRYDGGLLQFLLRGMMPQRYGAKIEHSGPQAGPIETKIEVVFLEPEPGRLDAPEKPRGEQS